MLISNKILIYIAITVFSLSTVSSIVSNVKDYFKEPTYTKEAVELILKHAKLKQEIEDLKIENQIIEKDNERIKQDISADSNIVWNSSKHYRDSLRSELFR